MAHTWVCILGDATATATTIVSFPFQCNIVPPVDYCCSSLFIAGRRQGLTRTETEETSVAAIPRTVTLGMVLKFFTGDEVEPLLGYHVAPITYFVKAETPRAIMPTANVCINKLNLPRQVPQLPKPKSTSETPSNEEETEFTKKELFEKYDMAFLTDYFGKI